MESRGKAKRGGRELRSQEKDLSTYPSVQRERNETAPKMEEKGGSKG